MHQLTKEQKLENLKEVYGAKTRKYLKLKDELNNLTKKISAVESSFQPAHLTQNEWEDLKQEWAIWSQENQNS